MNIKDHKIDFIYYSKFCTLISVIIILFSSIWFFLHNPNIGIDFSGGVMIEANIDNANNKVEEIREYLNNINYKGAIVYTSSKNSIIIKVKLVETKNKLNDLKEALFEKYKLDYQRAEFIGASVSKDMVKNGIQSVFFAILGVGIYVYIRFNIVFAISAFIGIIHDIILLLCFFIITKIEFNMTSIAAILTIIGYSINDTVVIFDRMRKQISSIGQSKDYLTNDIMNTSINLSLRRTIMTSVTTVLAALSMVLFSKGELQTFSIIICFGVIIGTYSSIIFVPFIMKNIKKIL